MKRLATPPASLGFRHPASLIATWFGTGLLPLAPGTWGSLAALPVGILIAVLGGTLGLLIATLLAFLVGVWAADLYAQADGRPDPPQVVIDEVAGQWLVLLAAPLDFVHIAAAFALFRLFDIVKPWPARRIERDLGGGLAIMLDDVVAGVYGYVVLAVATPFTT